MSSKCEKCGAKTVIKVSAKCSDMCCITYGNLEHCDYVPHDIGIGGGDYIRISYCHICTRIQSETISLETVKEVFEGEDEN